MTTLSERLAARWADLRAAGRPALIPYLTAGYPSPAITRDALRMLQDEGADVIEIGIPFSDPLADGPVIQGSTDVALAGGMSVAGALDLVAQAALTVPVIAFSYVNPILAYGPDRFLTTAREAGIDGVLLTDLPAGGDAALEGTLQSGALDLIRLVALTTTAERLAQVSRDARGFVYVISRLGVTGGAADVSSALEATVAAVRRHTDLPVAVGFGIDGGDRARQVAAFADGVVVGSALVRRLGEGLAPARDLVRELRSALDAVPVG